MKRHVLLYIINVILLIGSVVVALTGILKFPGLFDLINIDPYLLPLGLMTWLHDWLGLLIVLLTFMHLILNWEWIKGMTRKLVSKTMKKVILISTAAIVLIWTTIAVLPITISKEVQEVEEAVFEEVPEPAAPSASVIEERPGNTLPDGEGEVSIEDIGTFTFPVEAISTSRPDIFKPGAFSVFDILVYLDASGQIELDHVFSEEDGTPFIRSINGIENWWYIAYYDGGWSENNVWPMDIFPYKDRMFIRIIQVTPEELSNIYSVFYAQTMRTEENEGIITIPEVVINGPLKSISFENVVVSPHDLRDDYFQPGTITAIDATLSLGDAGLISYNLNWYESIGSAGVVKNYFVDAINDAKAAGRCGFVYEVGDRAFYGFRGNHIHIPPDTRVITAIPEYIEFFWICI